MDKGEKARQYYRAVHSLEAVREIGKKFLPGAEQESLKELESLWKNLPEDLKQEIGEPAPHTETDPWGRWKRKVTT